MGKYESASPEEFIFSELLLAQMVDKRFLWRKFEA